MYSVKQKRLYASFKKYGVGKHKFEIVEECDLSELNAKERYYQELFSTLDKKGLNCRLQGYDDKTGYLSEISKKKISLLNSGEGNGMYGKKLPPYRIQQLRSYKHTDEAKAKIAERSHRGRNPLAKIVLNTETGIYYDCIGDAADSTRYAYVTIKRMLNGATPNKTYLIKV